MTPFIYAIGNALVDIEINVTEQELSSLGIEKGVMSLVESNKMAQILKAFEPKPQHLSCGGSACNSVYGATQLGVPTAFSGRVSNDSHGTFYIQTLLDHHIQTTPLSALTSGTTGTCAVLITPDADRTLVTFLGESAQFSTVDVNESLLKNAQWLFIEGYLTTSPSSLEASLHAKSLAKQHHKKIALTLSDPSVVKFFRQGFNELLDSPVDLLFCNELEALTYTQTDSLYEAIECLKPIAKQFAITQGSQGASIFDGTHLHDISTHAVQAVDTNGAGDLFAASIFTGLYNHYPLDEAAKLGCHASSTLVTQYGPRMNQDTLNNVQLFKQSLEKTLTTPQK